VEALDATMMHHKIKLDPPPFSYGSHSKLESLYVPKCNVNVKTSFVYDWILYSVASHHMAKDKAMFYTLDDHNTKKFCVGDNRSLGVVGLGIVKLDEIVLNHILCILVRAYAIFLV